jgi:hypothetical protein
MSTDQKEWQMEVVEEGNSNKEQETTTRCVNSNSNNNNSGNNNEQQPVFGGVTHRANMLYPFPQQVLPQPQQHRDGGYMCGATSSAISPGAAQQLLRAKEKIGLATLGSELICAICQDFFVEASTVECGHSFCRMCIENWLKSKLTCPICRHPVNKPPIGSVCLDKAVRVMLDLNEETTAANQLMERQKQACKARENECFAQTCLETLFQRAVQQGVRVVHISKQWSPREQQRFLGGIERHQGVAREAYCKVVGLTYEWVGRASMDELLIAAANVMLKDMEHKPKNPSEWKESCITKLRARLEMYIRYG